MSELVTATGVLALLADEEVELKVFALQTLNEDIDTVWFEVAPAVTDIEALYEDESFPERNLAALVLSKVYFHLQAYDESMFFALAAGDLFKLDNPGEFEETIISKCVDHYIASKGPVPKSESHAAVDDDETESSPPSLATAFAHGASDGNASALISPTTPFSQSTLPSKSLLSRVSTDNAILEPSFEPQKKQHRSSSIALTTNELQTRRAVDKVIERLFESCIREGKYQQVVGIAVEAKRLEWVKHVIWRADEEYKRNKGKAAQDDVMTPAEELLDYCLGICMDVVQERYFRNDMLLLLLAILTSAKFANGKTKDPDYFSIAKCIVHLDQDTQACTVIRHLVGTESAEATAIAYQFAFDLHDNATQKFLGRVISGLPKSESATENKENEGGENAPLMSDVDQSNAEAADDVDEKHANIYKNIRSILDGTKTIKLNLEFLYRNNHTDTGILNKVRDSLEGRNSIFHTAVTFCNAFMNQGTTNDKFFRDNLEWLGKAVNWSKFTATAALGVIHRGNLSQSKKLLDPYLPRGAGGIGGSPYSQGGALYAYGLIHANHGADALDYLRARFTEAEEEVIQHGGALGLGLAGMASGNEEIFESLKGVLYADSALNGEAVGLSMGLIMLGTGNVKALEDMVAYAHETSHEKSVRGLALGMALIMYGRQEGADVMIEGLLNDPDPTLRYGGIMTVALAYCGTGSNKAVRKLLHVAVSDVNDDVRRIAVMSLGFILFRKPGSVPRMVELLSESYNPHVRYGSAMALGISCAGTGLDEAIDLLEPMMKDPTDFVRQGALIALAMIMIQQNEVMNPKVASIRKTLKRVVGDRHEDAMTKFGAAVALGIIDAGGRNCTIGLQTQTGSLNMAGIVGMAVFTQYWYWFPFTHFLSLAFSPTSIIALDHDLDIIDVKFHCATKPSLFDYPPEQEVKAEEGPAMIATAILSTTAQAKRRAQKKEKADKAQHQKSMDIDSTNAPTISNVAAGGDKMDIDDNAKSSDESKEKKEEQEAPAPSEKETSAPPDAKKKLEKEKPGYEIENMSRVLPGQLKYISLVKGRYWPVKLVRPGPLPTGGPLLLHDTQPEKEKSLVEEKLKKVATERAPVATSSHAQGRNPRSVEEAILNRLANNPPVTPSRNQSGAAAAAGVLTAIDEDGEDDEEASVPRDFEYDTDDEGDD
ncbi:armadillo-type protein [Nemania serpens]|nr:armadillo-type protein [Nemania serpens]